VKTKNQKQEMLNRLSYIEGHLKGIRKMIEEDQYCVDILKQTYAVHRAIDKLESVLLHGHLKSCVVQGIHEGREEEVIGELGDLYDLAQR
jgi:DNA-binding FrmR family transcriptional regulator